MNENYDSETIAKNEEHIRNTYLDKASRLIKISIGLAIFVFITELGYFNEIKSLSSTFLYIASSIIIIISIIFAFITKESIERNNIEIAKGFIILAVITAFLSTLSIALFCLINNEIINLRSVLLANGNYELESAYIESGLAAFYGTPDVYCCAAIIASAINCLIITVLQYRAINSVLKADGTVKSTDFVEKFYDNL